MLHSIHLAGEHGVRDRVLALRSLDSFSSQSDEALATIAERAMYRHFEEGDEILTEGQPIEAVHIVLHGVIDVFRLGKHVTTVRRGRGVGFLSHFARDENGVRAVALEHTDTIEIPIDALEDAREEHFSLVRNGIRLEALALLNKRNRLPVEPDKAERARMGERPERDLTLTERVLRTREGVLFSRCNTDAIVELMRRGHTVTYQPGDRLWRAGDEPTFYIRIEYGIVDCTAPDGRSVEIGADFTLGVHDCFAAEPRGYTAVARTEVIGFVMEIESMLGVLETHYELAQDLQGLLARPLLEGN